MTETAETNMKTIGVLGCGLMGSGIAEVCAMAGYRTIVREVDESLVQAGVGRIEASLGKAVKREKITSVQRDEGLARVTGTTRLEDLAACDLVIEAIVENLAVKRETFAALDGIVGPTAILASNTSSLCITEMAASTNRADRFLGVHFFSPVPVMKLVELSRGLETSDETYERARAFAESLGKQIVTAPDRPGFIVNRLLIPYLLHAVRSYESGLGTLEDIDKSMTLGCGHPMGPFTLIDFIGVDVTYFIANAMYEEFREPIYAPSPLLKRMVLAGRLGRKSGRGFFEY